MTERLWNIVVEAFPRILLPGLQVTLPLTILAFFFSTVIAVLVAMAQYAHVRVLTPILRFYIWIIRGTPLLVQLFVVFYGLPSVGLTLDPFPAAVICFAINEGAYEAETVRAALEAVPVGQVEAGYCVGMTYTQIMRRIVLPQAFRTAAPSLFNGLISMVKDTSLASNIMVVEMFMATRRVVGVYYEPLVCYLEVGFIYLMFSTLLTWLQRLVERRLNASVGREVKTHA